MGRSQVRVRAIRAERRRLGQCVYCGVAAVAGRVTCPKHAAAVDEASRRAWQRRVNKASEVGRRPIAHSAEAYADRVIKQVEFFDRLHEGDDWVIAVNERGDE